MTQQVQGTTQKLADSQCAQAYQNSLRCELTLAALAAPAARSPGSLPLYLRILPNVVYAARSASVTATAAAAAAAAAATRCRRHCRRCWPASSHRRCAGLDKNQYDKSKCKAEFEAYKQCKREEVGAAGVAQGRTQTTAIAGWLALLACRPASS